MENGKVIALLIDAENVSPKYIKTILDELSLYGTPAYKRIYGDWTSADMSSWKKVLNEHNLTPMQQFSYTQGKNASDSAMIIDAMDILYTRNVDGFCIVSSDSDFTRLASRLRESRMFVIGMGESKTPPAFKSACDTFKYLDVLMGMKPAAPAAKDAPKSAAKKSAHESAKESAKETAKEAAKEAKEAAKDSAARDAKSAAKDAQPAKAKAAPAKEVARDAAPAKEPAPEKPAHAAKQHAPEPPEPPAEAAQPASAHSEEELAGAFVPLDEIVDKIREIIDYDSDEDGYMPLSQVGVMLSRLYPDFDSRNYGFSKLHKLIDYAKAFETKYEQFENGGKNLVIRNK